MFWVCVLRVGINIISTQNKKLSMRHFTIMVNPNKSSLSNQIPKIKVAEFSPATTFRPPSVCEVNNSNANFSPKKVPTYSQLGKYYYGGNRVCVSFLSSVRRVANPDPALFVSRIQNTIWWIERWFHWFVRAAWMCASAVRLKIACSSSASVEYVSFN